jgi:hypothetical protein
VFTARYALSPYIKQIRFVFKGLILFGWETKLSDSSLCSFVCSPVAFSMSFVQILSSAPFFKWASLSMKEQVSYQQLAELWCDLFRKIGGVIHFLNWIIKNNYWTYPNLVMSVTATWCCCSQIAYVQTPYYVVNRYYAFSFVWLWSVGPRQ